MTCRHEVRQRRSTDSSCDPWSWRTLPTYPVATLGPCEERRKPIKNHRVEVLVAVVADQERRPVQQRHAEHERARDPPALRARDVMPKPHELEGEQRCERHEPGD